MLLENGGAGTHLTGKYTIGGEGPDMPFSACRRQSHDRHRRDWATIFAGIRGFSRQRRGFSGRYL